MTVFNVGGGTTDGQWIVTSAALMMSSPAIGVVMKMLGASVSTSISWLACGAGCPLRHSRPP
ncbi:hypothetical protein [Vibrio vulnificus]|uniref:Uncharacterized protein n=1 Tax=Vibrio vulnificus TaxID=672 RepID=A0AAN1UC24_VIBVL|nr:hypothetical protein [Vibrio vulnificus]AXX59964.1 hypothetical protein FORC53_1625 [Vibrio vulnificus]